MSAILTLWVIYRMPSDYPQNFVVRAHDLLADGSTHPRPEPLLALNLEGARALLPAGVTNIRRYANDDPVIAEVWV